MEPESKKARLDIEDQHEKEGSEKAKTDSAEGSNDVTMKDDVPGEVNDVSEEKAATTNTKDSDLKLTKEEDVGILCYISDLPGCHGVIKQRYSDFIVNEVDESGEVVYLTKLEVGPETKLKSEEVDFDLPDGLIQSLTELSSATDPNPDYINIENMEDKEQRTNYHKAIKAKFLGLDTSTVCLGDKKHIKVFKRTNDSTNKKSKTKWKQEWPKDRGDYCRFVLYKENRDTMAAINDLSRFLRVNRNIFHYAGTKDKRAKTCQEVTAYRLVAERLEDLNTRMKYMKFGNFRYVNKPLKLGQCKGNRFTVVLRNVTESETLTKAMTSLKDKGFINYYGMQRFGTTTVPTHHIGRSVLKNDYEEAVNLILRPRPGENGKVVACRECWQKNKNAAEALKGLPNENAIERTILTELKSNSRNYSNAFQRIGRNTKLLYLHSYQSYIWNTVASHRIKQYGLKPIIGDLVLTQDIIDAVEGGEDNGSGEVKRAEPTVVTESNLSQYNIQDVVLPLPGHDVLYPDNDVGNLYQTLFKEDELSMDSLKHRVKSLALPGAYRRVLVQPTDVSWKFYSYDDVSVDLTLSDVDKLNNKPEPQSQQANSRHLLVDVSSVVYSKVEEEYLLQKHSLDGQYTALRIDLTLPTSCYATMALREVLKVDTSSSYQSTLNVS